MAETLEIIIIGKDQASGPLGEVKISAVALGTLAGNIATGGLGMLMDALGGVARLATEAAGNMLDFVGSGVGMAGDLEAQFDGIQASIGATNEEISSLKDLSLDLAIDPNLKVSATEATDAIQVLGTAGASVEEILGGMGEATVLLQNAVGGDFSNAAAIGTDAMNLWNIKAEEMVGAVSNITAVTVASKFGIDDYRLALAAAGGVASAVGLDFDDFNTAIAAISPSFASGSDAGTSFKTFLQRLPGVSGPAKDALAELGIITEDGSNKFFDAQGNLRNMADISGVLKEAFSGLTEEQKLNLATTAFGTDAMRAMFALAETGAEGFAALQAEMGKTDAVDAAATRMDNFKGAMEVLDGVIEAVKLQIGDALLPTLTDMAKTVTGFVTNHGPLLVELFKDIGKWASENVVSGFSSVVEAVSRFISSIEKGKPVIASLQFALAAMLPANLVNNVVAFSRPIVEFITSLMEGQDVISSARDALATFIPESTLTAVTNFADTVAGIVSPIIDFISQNISLQDILVALGGVIAAIVIPAFYSIATAAAPVLAIAALLVGAVALVRNAWEQDWGGIRTAVTGFWAEAQPILAEIGSLIGEIFGEIGSIIGEMAGALGESGGPVIEWGDIFKTVAVTILVALKALVNRLKNILKVIRDFWDKHGDEIIAIIKAAFGIIKTTIETTIKVVMGIIRTVLAVIRGDWKGVWDEIKEIVATIWEAIKSNITNMMNIIKTLIGSWLNELLNTFDSIWNNILNLITTIWDIIRTVIQAATAAIQSLINSWLNTLQNLFDTAWNAIRQLIQAAWQAITSIIQTATNALQNLINSWLNTLQGLFDAAWNAIRQLIQTVWNAIQQIIQQVTTAIQNLISSWLNAIQSLMQSVWNTIQQIIQTAWQAIQNIIQTVTSAIQNIISSWITTIQNLMQSGWNTIQNVIQTVWNTISSIISSATASIQNLLSSWLNTLQSIFSTGWAAVNTAVQAAFTAMNQIVQSSMALVRATVDAGLQALSALMNTGTAAWNAVMSIGSRLIDAIRSGWDTVTDFASSLSSRIIDWISGITWPVNIGQAGSRIVQSIRDGFNAATDFVSGVVGTLTDWISDLVSGNAVINAAKKAGEEIVEEIKNGFLGAQNIFNLGRDAIKNWILSWFSPIPEAQHAGFEVVDNILTGFLNQQGNFTRTLRGSLLSWVGDAASGIGAGLQLSGSVGGGLALAGAGAGAGGGTGIAYNYGGLAFHTTINYPLEEARFEMMVETALQRIERRNRG
jgi:TP901 family phage tail tape measure protein